MGLPHIAKKCLPGAASTASALPDLRTVCRSVLAPLVLLAQVACGGGVGTTGASASPRQAALAQTAWVLEGSGAGRVPTLQFEGIDKVFGLAACNTYSGTVQWSGEQLQMGLATTKMYCSDAGSGADQPSAVMAAETRFLDALQATRSLSIEADHLLLRGADGTLLLQFKRQ
ncbi:MAG: META domain-containing protein [Rhodoferax sp.]